MRRRSRQEYVRDKLVYHLARFSPGERLAILREVAAELARQDGRTYTAETEVHVRPEPRPGRHRLAAGGRSLPVASPLRITAGACIECRGKGERDYGIGVTMPCDHCAGTGREPTP